MLFISGALLSCAVAAYCQAVPSFAAPDLSTSAVQHRIDAVQSSIRNQRVSAVPQLIADFDAEQHPTVRAWILRGLTSLDPAQALPVLKKGVLDPAPEVRLVAAGQLGRLASPEAEAALIAALAAEVNAGVRQTMVFWLGTFKDPAAVSALGQVLNKDANVSVRAQAARSLKSLGTPKAKRALKAGQEDADERVRKLSR